MYPSKGLSPTPVVGSLEVPLELSDLKNTFYGSPTMGSTTTPTPNTAVRNTLWSSLYDDGDVVITDGSKQFILFTRSGITELSVCFDGYMLPFVSYVYNGDSYFRFYDITTKSFVTRNLTELSRGVVKTPRATYDDRRLQFRYSASVIVGYIVDRQLIIRTSDDRFRTPVIIHEFADNKNYLNQISMGDNNRLHFVPYRIEE